MKEKRKGIFIVLITMFTRVFIGIITYICFVQPYVWEYTLETFSPPYLTIQRIVNAKGIILCREKVIESPVSGVIMKVKSNSMRISKGDTIAIVLPTIEDYKSYIGKVNSITSYYDKAIEEKDNIIAGKEKEIEKIYEDLNKESELLNSLVANKQDVAEVLNKINELNSRINSLKVEIENLTKELEVLKREKLLRLADLRQNIISSNIKVISDRSGLVSFCIDGMEDARNIVIERGSEDNLNIDSLLRESKVINDGDPVRKGDIIAKVIDNLEQFILLEVSLDGKSPIEHNNYNLNIDGKDVNIEFIKWVGKYPRELWLCKIKSPYYIGPRRVSLNINVGTIEGLVVPRNLVKQEGERYFVYIVNNNYIEKRFVNILGGNEKEVVIDNINRGELLFVD
ncbi:MAG: hypothetical protein N2380_08390 [bacterium]|nr:hypothetical protein [bacterium]